MATRMRKKRHFDERIEACADLLLAKGAGEILNMKEAAEHFRNLVDFRAVFGNDHPVELEIGCGKGGFIIEKAKRNPNVNYIALEKMSNVILTPLEKTREEGLSNLKYLNIRAECLPCYIPERSLSKIYLNFSTPLPKLGYASQRLTHRNFLNMYKKLLKKGGEIAQKTDNRDFFEFSLQEYAQTGYEIREANFNLHEHGNPEDNVVTEYERKWIEQGLPIHFVKAVLPE